MTTRPIAVEAFQILEAPRLDTITVVLQDVGPGSGRVLVECAGNAWACQWDALGERRVKHFLSSLEAEYLAECLQRGRQRMLLRREREVLRRVAQAVLETMK